MAMPSGTTLGGRAIGSFLRHSPPGYGLHFFLSLPLPPLPLLACWREESLEIGGETMCGGPLKAALKAVWSFMHG